MNDKEKEIKFFYVDKEKLKSMSIKEQIEYLLNKVEKGFVIIIDTALDPIVTMKLTEKILLKVKENPEIFKGIECLTIEKNEKRSFFSNIFSKIIKKNEGISIIGPSHVIKKIERDGNLINLRI